MNDTILTLVIIGIAAAVAAIVIFQRAQRKKAVANTVRLNLPITLPPSLPYSTGARFGVPYIQSVVPIPESAAEAIGRGIVRQIATTPAHWTNKREVENYDVVLINPDRINLDGSPALSVRGIQSAGTVIGVANDGHVPSVIVLPHQANQNWQFLDYLEQSARHESEHDAEWANDQSVFWQFIGAGDIHPHFP